MKAFVLSPGQSLVKLAALLGALATVVGGVKYVPLFCRTVLYCSTSFSVTDVRDDAILVRVYNRGLMETKVGECYLTFEHLPVASTTLDVNSNLKRIPWDGHVDIDLKVPGLVGEVRSGESNLTKEHIRKLLLEWHDPNIPAATLSMEIEERNNRTRILPASLRPAQVGALVETKYPGLKVNSWSAHD